MLNHHKLRNLRYVRRFGVHHTSYTESVAEHSLFVALLAADIAASCRYSQARCHRLAYAALIHDAGEAILSDISYLVLRYIPADVLHDIQARITDELGVTHLTVSDKDRAIIEMADVLEAMLHTDEEIRSGNRRPFEAIYHELWWRLLRSPMGEHLARWHARRLGLPEVEPIEPTKDLVHE
jgi:5'-deoxynucleotidase YfbR-like HD superfamily hydrolase